MQNFSISLDDKTADWARVEAARRGVTISRLVADLLHEQMDRDDHYERARRSYLAQPARDLSSESGPYPSRDELYRR